MILNVFRFRVARLESSEEKSAEWEMAVGSDELLRNRNAFWSNASSSPTIHGNAGRSRRPEGKAAVGGIDINNAGCGGAILAVSLGVEGFTARID